MDAYRHVEVIYCDDIRRELGNKLSFMGAYTGDLLVGQFPATLLKLSLYISVSTPRAQPFQRLHLRILQDDELLVESDFPEQDLATGQAQVTGADDPVAENRRINAHIELVATNLTFNAAATIRVRVDTESEELMGRALRVLKLPSAPT